MLKNVIKAIWNVRYLRSKIESDFYTESRVNNAKRRALSEQRKEEIRRAKTKKHRL